jgi:two-component system, cell cycle sensor histidine kinase and response regulator CckA
VATILIVDDNPPIRTMLTETLGREGYTVVTAENGAQAFRILRSHQNEFDLVVSDLMMPEIDGPTLAATLLVEHPTLPVLLMSGGSQNLDLNSFKTLQFLAKPFDLTTFLATVHRLLKEQTSPAAAWVGSKSPTRR